MMNKYNSLCTWFNGDRNLKDPDSGPANVLITMEVERCLVGSGYNPGDETKRRLRRGLVCPVWENITLKYLTHHHFSFGSDLGSLSSHNKKTVLFFFFFLFDGTRVCLYSCRYYC